MTKGTQCWMVGVSTRALRGSSRSSRGGGPSSLRYKTEGRARVATIRLDVTLEGVRMEGVACFLALVIFVGMNANAFVRSPKEEVLITKSIEAHQLLADHGFESSSPIRFVRPNCKKKNIEELGGLVV